MAIRKQRQVDLEFKASLVYVVSSGTERHIINTVSKK